MQRDVKEPWPKEEGKREREGEGKGESGKALREAPGASGRGFSVDYPLLAAKLICLLGLLCLLWLIFKYVLVVFLPFLLAWGLAFLVHPVAARLSARLHLPRKLCAAVLMTLLLLVLVFLTMLGINRLIFESEKLLSFLAEDSAHIGETVASFFEKLASFGNGADGHKIPLFENLMKIEALRDFWENIDSIIAGALSDAVKTLTRGIPSLIVAFLGRLPSFLLFLLVMLLSCFYFCLDLPRIHSACLSLLPRRWQAHVPALKKRFAGTAVRYLRAYLLLMSLTFCELFVGFSILHVSYPLLLALVVAVVDILPVLGVGSVLIPWAAVELLFLRNYPLGFGLAILYAIVVVVRQITEPRVVAGSLGLHPLATVVAMYAGLRFLGFFGMLLGPMALILGKILFGRPKNEPSGKPEGREHP